MVLRYQEGLFWNEGLFSNGMENQEGFASSLIENFIENLSAHSKHREVSRFGDLLAQI